MFFIEKKIQSILLKKKKFFLILLKIFNYYIKMKEGDRSFTIKNISSNKKIKSKLNGRYISKSPINAAKKALNHECRESKIKGVCTFNITIKETTEGSKKNEYTYKVKRSKLKKPLKINKGGVDIIINYKTNAKMIKKYTPIE